MANFTRPGAYSNATLGSDSANADGSGRPPFRPGGIFGDDDLGPSTRVAVWLLVGSSAVFLGLRLYCKLIRHRRLHWDDWVLTAAWVCHSISNGPDDVEDKD